MVGPYPAAAALRRRQARMEANGEAFPDAAPENIVAREQVDIRQARRNPAQQRQQRQPKLSSLYCLVSLCLALLAIITSSSHTSTVTDTKHSVEDMASVDKMHPSQQQQEPTDFFKSWFSSNEEGCCLPSRKK